jgi:hypothetical protein
LLDFKGAKALVFGPDAADGTVGGVPLADLGDGAAKLGADGFNEGGVVTNGDGVGEGELNGTASGVTSSLRTGLAGEEDGNVSPDSAEALALVVVEADAESDEHNDGSDAPDDAEHGEEAAEFALPEGTERLFEDLDYRHSRDDTEDDAGWFRDFLRDGVDIWKGFRAGGFGMNPCNKINMGLKAIERPDGEIGGHSGLKIVRHMLLPFAMCVKILNLIAL